jgi:gluconokinase
MPSVSLAAAEAPLALALDLGTSSLRAMVFDRRGRGIGESEEQLPYVLQTTPDGGAEFEAGPLFDLLVRCLDGTVERAGGRAGEIVAVGWTCFWHSLLGLDDRGEPVTPIFYWADTRAAPAAAELRRELDEAAVLARTGCRLHVSYWPAKLRWLTRTQPDVTARVARWVSFAEYAAARLLGTANAGVTFSMASGTGLLDVHRLTWDEDVLMALGLTPERLSPLIDARDGGRLTAEHQVRWPALASLPWYQALGDGACANVGSGAVGAGRIALTMGTSGAMRLVLPVPAGGDWTFPPELWAYRLDRERAVLGGALSNGGNLLRWTRELLGVDVDGAASALAAGLKPDSHGLTVLPFVAGERSPGWHDQATGAVTGLTLATRPEHLLRGAMEAVALRFARLYDALVPLAAPQHQVVANGGAILNSPAMLQIVADALGHDLIALPPEDEASARGAALVALVAAEILSDLGGADDPAAEAVVYHPDATRHEIYRTARERQERLEAMLYPARGERLTVQ